MLDNSNTTPALVPPLLLLASSSAYRQTLLAKLALPFETASPDIDETRHTNEHPEHLVTRLSREKAQALRQSYPDHVIIGSDQVAYIGSKQSPIDSSHIRDQAAAATHATIEVLGKPHTSKKAFAQLSACSGKQVQFVTGLSVAFPDNSVVSVCEYFTVYFNHLSAAQIKAYINKEQPLNCAGSFKSEGLGICLFDKLEGRDPNTLVGLPLIALVAILRNRGIEPLSY